jgi:aldehyde dehydrogenase (NAD+)
MATLEFNTAEVHRIYALQNTAENLQRLKNSSANERLDKVRKIEKFILSEDSQKKLADALWKDLRKSESEMLSTEIAPVLTAIQHVKSETKSWMRDKSVDAPLALAGIYSHIRYEPKGHVLIIAPWNYPFQLVLNPLIHAIVAGNAILIKPSEIASNTAFFIQEMISTLFDEKEIAVVQGDVPTTSELLKLPFNHIFFTGSPAVGKIVMRAAAEHLTSVTLELGGKSPVIVDDSVNVKKMAMRIAWAKTVNNGQICIAPDYLLIHESKKEEFIVGFKETIQKFFNPTAECIQNSPDYGRIIDEKNFLRLKRMVHDSVAQGAKILLGGEMIQDEKFIAPILMDNVTENMPIMQEEIFGPILPILTFKDLKEVPQFIQKFHKPLAMYICSSSSKNIEYLLQNTSAGGTVINDFLTTPVNPHLPFGGVNNSGIGKSNGFHGFVEFSNERGVMRRRWMNFRILYPPFKLSWVKLLLKATRI